MPIAISPPTTDIEIISQACTLCGKGSFNTIDAGGQFAEDAAQFYGTLVSAELGSNRWRFAQAYQQMGTLSTLTPNFEGWQYYWDFPADLIMLHRIYPLLPYIVFGTRILTTTNQNLTAIYSQNVPVSKWPPTFSMYIIYHLASILAITVATNDGLANKIEVGKQLWQSRAEFADSQNSPSRQMKSIPWIQARFNYRTRNDQWGPQ